jgi:tetratricopeptide (TPR) repeat protein
MSKMLDNLARVSEGQGREQPQLALVRSAVPKGAAGAKAGPRPIFFALGIAAVGVLAFVQEGGIGWFTGKFGWQHEEIIPEPPSLASSAVAALKAGNFAEAQRLLDSGLQKNPVNATFWINRGYALKRLGQSLAAETSYRKALALQPRNAYALNDLGMLYFDTGRFAEAAQLLEQAVAADATYADARLNLAAVYERREHWPEAAAQYNAYLDQASPDEAILPVIRERARKVRTLAAAAQSKEKF